MADAIHLVLQPDQSLPLQCDLRGGGVRLACSSLNLVCILTETLQSPVPGVAGGTRLASCYLSLAARLSQPASSIKRRLQQQQQQQPQP